MAALRLDEAQTRPRAGDPPARARAGSPERRPSPAEPLAPQLPSQARRRRGERERPSKFRGVRLLWEESGLGMVGVFCVATFALAVTWYLLEGMLQLNGAFSGIVALATAVGALEGISRRHYEQRRTTPSLQHAPAAGAPQADAHDELAARRRAA